MSLTTVKTAITNKLSDMQSLKQVYQYETSNSEGNYPFATIKIFSGEAEFRSTAHNLRTYSFVVNVYQEMAKQGQGPEQAESIMTSVIDEMEIAFDMDTTLSGVVKYAQPVRWTADYEDRELDTRLGTIIIEALDLVSSA